MSWNERIGLYEQIEKKRERPLIVYVTSKREGVGAQMATDALPKIIDQLDNLPTGSKALDLLIASYGGDPMVAWRIMTLIRERVKDVSVLIPQSAYSAATLLAFGADQIIMHPNGHLGPVDMQITSFGERGLPKTYSTEDIGSFLDFVKDKLKITDQEHIRMLFEVTCKEVGSLGIGFTARISKLAVDLGERLLALPLKEKKNDEESRSKLRTVVENMSRKFQSHNYPVSRTEALEIGLRVKEDRDEGLEKLMWSVWLDVESDLKENIPFDPLVELLNSAEASKLLAPVPQLDVPIFSTASAHYQTTIADVVTATKQSINPVDFAFTSAIVESSRLAHAQIARGKILACRKPDLYIQSNLLITSRTWENIKGRPGKEQGKHE